MASNGGPNDFGYVFKVKPDGSGYAILHDFCQACVEGTHPYGSLISDGTFLYGMTRIGGLNNSGTIFRIKPDGTGFAKLHEFDVLGLDGYYPLGNLFSDGTFLYGTTSVGGTNNLGTIFKMKPDATGYIKMFEFAGANGKYPQGSLISDGTFLYGMTSQGGTNDSGAIFKIKPDGTGYVKLLDFAGGANGKKPQGSLLSVGTFFYGMTIAGGMNDSGIIFKIKPDGSGFVKLHDFAIGSDGSSPYGSLISDGTFLYGMTYQGGANNLGVLFKMKLDGSGYSKLLDFDGSNGQYPYGSLLYSGGFLYGMTYQGGTANDGVVFKYAVINVSASMLGNPICSNQCLGSAGTSISNGTPPYTYLWSTSPAQTTSTATGLCAATYTVTVSDNSGSAWDTVKINPLPQPSAPSICAVTVDSLSQYNIIVWDKTSFQITDTCMVYRDIANNNYALIGKVPYNSLSMFTDTVRTLYAANGDPNISSWKYKIAVKDTCGNISVKSPFHKSLFTQNNTGNFSWNNYQIEGQPLPVPALSNYLFQRDNLSNGNWVTIQTLSASSNAYTDPQYSTYQSTASWRAATSWSISCTPTLVKNPQSMATTINNSKSNSFKTNATTSANELSLQNSISIFPNPSNGEFKIQSSKFQVKGLEVYNVYGEKVQSEIIFGASCVIHCALPNGIYFAHIKTEICPDSYRDAVKKIIINR